MAIAVSKPPMLAFLGLGAMGFAMSTHLVRQGVSVTGFDIWKPTLERFDNTCKTIPNAEYSTAVSPAEAVKSASIVLLMVATHHHVNSALFDAEIGAIKTIPKGSTIIIASTVPPTYPPEVRQRLDTEFSRPDIKLIDAPVSGGTVRSANGTLTIMSSSNIPFDSIDPAVRHVLSTLSTNGKTLFTIPGTLGAGTSAKALNQVQCGVHIVAGSEIMALAALNNLNTLSFYNTMKTSDPQTGTPKYGWTWMFENRGPRMLDPTLPISSAVSIINKDVGIIKDEETRLNIELPLLNKTYAVLSETMAADMASVDDAYINRFYLGLNSTRADLAVTQASPSTTCADQDTKIASLLLAHAIINFQSAYETCAFAEALDLLGEAQRKTWFTIIAGAAGASRVFSEVIPVAFEALAGGKRWQEGFRSYAKSVFVDGFSSGMAGVDSLVTDAKAQGVQPILLETALAFLKEQTA